MPCAVHGALVRKRGVRMRRICCIWVCCMARADCRCERSPASTEAGIADLCDVSLLDRLRNAGEFFADVVDHVLADRRGDPGCEVRAGLSLVDGSTVSLPGSAGSDWRLHARYETAVGRFTDLVITEARTAEALCCVAVRPGDVVVHDRGYARVRNFVHARAQGADFSLGSAGVRSGCSILQVRASIFSPRCLKVASRWWSIRYGSAMPATASRRADHRAQAAGGDRASTRAAAPQGSRNGQMTDPRTRARQAS